MGGPLLWGLCCGAFAVGPLLWGLCCGAFAVRACGGTPTHQCVRVGAQARFSGTAQYLKSAKKFGLLDFDGELPLPYRGLVVVSHSIAQSRDQMLQVALRQPKLVVPTLTAAPAPIRGMGSTDVGTVGDGDSGSRALIAKLATKLQAPRFQQQIDGFLQGSFDGEIMQYGNLEARSTGS